MLSSNGWPYRAGGTRPRKQWDTQQGCGCAGVTRCPRLSGSRSTGADSCSFPSARRFVPDAARPVLAPVNANVAAASVAKTPSKAGAALQPAVTVTNEQATAEVPVPVAESAQAATVTSLDGSVMQGLRRPGGRR